MTETHEMESPGREPSVKSPPSTFESAAVRLWRRRAQYTILVLLTTWLIGGAVQVQSQLQLIHGRRMEDIGFMSAFIVALVVALYIYFYKWISLVLTPGIDINAEELRFMPMPYRKRLACVAYGPGITLVFSGVVGCINTVLTLAAWWWFNDLHFASYPQGTPPMHVLATINAGMLTTVYFTLTVLTAFQVGYHQAWDESRGDVVDCKQSHEVEADIHYAGQSRVVINGWLRLWDLSTFFY